MELHLSKHVKLECVVNGTSSQIPMLPVNVANSMTDGRMDSLLHTLIMKGSHVGNWLNSPSGLRGDSMTDRLADAGQTDAERKNNIALPHPYHEGKSCGKFG